MQLATKERHTRGIDCAANSSHSAHRLAGIAAACGGRAGRAPLAVVGTPDQRDGAPFADVAELCPGHRRLRFFTVAPFAGAVIASASRQPDVVIDDELAKAPLTQ
jgi:hypothetical protein